MTCRHCGEDLNTLQPRTGIFRHQVGLCMPSRNEVEAAIAQLEIEDEREKQVIRRYWDMQREQQRQRRPHVRRWAGILIGMACLTVVGYLFVILWMSL